MQDAVIVRAFRTAIGSFGGALAQTPAHELGATVIRALLQDSGDRADFNFMGIHWKINFTIS